jgi:hypothetical protein
MTVEAAVSESTQQSRAKVFISYSRKDMAFANQLEAALKARGFEPLIDRSEIYAFEEWWKRIEALIVRADTVVFVLSPDSVASEVALKPFRADRMPAGRKQDSARGVGAPQLHLLRRRGALRG